MKSIPLGSQLCFLAAFICLSGNLFAQQPVDDCYAKNSAKAPKQQTITDGGIVVTIGETIRLTPAPISAMHPFMKSIRLDNGDLLFGCPLSGGTFRDHALSPKEDGADCSLRSTDGGRTWQKSQSETTRDDGKTWTSEPTIVRRAARLEDGSFVSDYNKALVCSLSPKADKQFIYQKTPASLQYGNHMIQLKDGKLLCAGQIDRLDMILKGQTFEKGCSYGLQFRTSADRGKTWLESGQLCFKNFGLELEKQGDATIDGYGEPWLLRAANGDLLAFLRTVKFVKSGESVQRPKYPPVKVSRSTDEGKTWSLPIEVHPTGVMPVATLLDNGMIVAFTGRGGNRVAVSRDHGQTWHCRHNIMFTGQSPNFSGHNTILPLPGGRALLIYTENHRNPDFEKDPKYSAELIGTFLTLKPDNDAGSGPKK